VAANGDVRNAFNEAHREAMATGIAALRERGGRAMIAFFMQMYGTSSELSFFGEDGERHIVKGERGCTQRCALGMLMFGLATHPLVVESPSTPDVRE